MRNEISNNTGLKKNIDEIMINNISTIKNNLIKDNSSLSLLNIIKNNKWKNNIIEEEIKEIDVREPVTEIVRESVTEIVREPVIELVKEESNERLNNSISESNTFIKI